MIITSSPTQFEPINFNITIENREEAQAFFALFNYTPNTMLIGEGNAAKLRSIIGDRNVGFSDIIANGITYKKYYTNKQER